VNTATETENEDEAVGLGLAKVVQNMHDIYSAILTRTGLLLYRKEYNLYHLHRFPTESYMPKRQ